MAKEWGVKNVIKVENGTVVKLSHDHSEAIGLIPTGYFGVDGKQLIEIDGDIIKDRYKLQHAGIVIIGAVIDSKNGNVIGDIDLKAYGSYDFRSDKESLEWMKQDVIRAIKSSNKELIKNKSSFKDKIFNKNKRGAGNHNKIIEAISKSIKNKIRKNFNDLVGKRPMIEVIVKII
jgi:mRNA degradation ribonuclease J1/J2